MNNSNDDFEDIFSNENTEDITPEPVTSSAEAKPDSVMKKKKPGVTRIILFGMIGTVVLLVVFIFISALNKDGSSEKTRLVTENQSVSQEPSSELAAEKSLFDENKKLLGLLEQARKSIEIRDKRYLQLRRDYDELKDSFVRNESLLRELGKNKSSHDEKSRAVPGNASGTVLKDISLISIYHGYAFVKKGNTAFSLTVGDKINNGIVQNIDPVQRRIITTKGVIE